MVHIKEKEEQKLFFDPDFDATFEEAVEFMKEKLSLTPEEFYRLDAKARFRAFTVAKLTGLDAIERVKEKLIKAIEEGKTLKEWIEELGEDGILKAVGFHRQNPWYLETVFRTNISTAYNAGRLMQIQRSKDKIKYLEYIAIDDSRTTPICRRLDRTKLPADDPFWATYTPPNHFNCRSTVRAIFRDSEEAKRVRRKKPGELPTLPEGFAGSPLDSWWELTKRMKRRAKKYGIDKEIEQFKRRLGLGEPEKLFGVKVSSYKDFSLVLRKYAEKYPEFRRGFREVKTTRTSSYFMATDCAGGIYISLTKRFKGFRPAHHLKSAFQKIARGETLSFEEEYAIETLWHEVLHNNIESLRLLAPSETFQNALYETCNQFVARHTYDRFLERLGGKAVHKERVLEEGLAYYTYVKNFRTLLAHLGVDEREILPVVEKAIFTDYHTVLLERLSSYIAYRKTGKMWGAEFNRVERGVKKMLRKIKSEPSEFLEELKKIFPLSE